MDVLVSTFCQKSFQFVILPSAAIEGKSQNVCIVIIFDCLQYSIIHSLYYKNKNQNKRNNQKWSKMITT